MLTIQHITVDSRDPYGLAGFWSSVTGWPISAEDSPGDPEVLLEPTESGAPELLFVAVPDGTCNEDVTECRPGLTASGTRVGTVSEGRPRG
jgi:hypothetical protein